MSLRCWTILWCACVDTVLLAANYQGCPELENDMKTVESLVATLRQIIGLERERAIILTGFYLVDDEIDLLRPLLQSDRLEVGAVGRYMNIPVFSGSQSTRTPGTTGGQDALDGVRFTFVQMDVVD